MICFKGNIALKLSKKRKMKELPKERMGEIALSILREKTKGERIPELNALKRTLGNSSKELGVPMDELLSFWIKIYSELFSALIAEAEEITFEKEIPKQPSPLKVAGDKIKGFIGLKK